MEITRLMANALSAAFRAAAALLAAVIHLFRSLCLICITMEGYEEIYPELHDVKLHPMICARKGSSHKPNKSIHETPSSLLSDHIPAVLSPSPGDFPAKVSQQSEEIRKARNTAANFCEVPWACERADAPKEEATALPLPLSFGYGAQQ